MASLSLQHINKTYPNGFEAVKDFNLEIEDKEFIIFVGPSGCGKTTILNILIGEESYDSGDLFKSRDLNIGYLKQHHDLDMNKTIYECALEVFDPLIQIENRMRELESMMSYDHSEQVMNEYDSLTQKFNEKDGFSYPSRIVGVLKGMGFVEEDFQKYVHELSGGQKTRLCLAKLLLEEPKLLVLDEPTAGLDPQGIREMMDLFKSIHQLGKTVILVTHDMNHVLEYCNEVIVMNEGCVERKGKVKDVFKDSDYLLNLGIDLPLITNMIIDLNKKGFQLDTSINNIDDLVEALGGELYG